MLIQRFIQHYAVDLSESVIENARDFDSFNAFFTRRLKPNARPFTPSLQEMISPCDGTVAAIGNINKDLLLQAKNQYFSLSTLLGNDASLVPAFQHGHFTTLYLAPSNYHRVHMPIDGTLEKIIYIPGDLFSVNRMTASCIPNLYARNERVVALFTTPLGKMAVILVGALIVGSLNLSWETAPLKSNHLFTKQYDGIHLKQGDELGFFQAGSTVILLFEENQMNWLPIDANAPIRMGQALGVKAQHRQDNATRLASS